MSDTFEKDPSTSSQDSIYSDEALLFAGFASMGVVRVKRPHGLRVPGIEGSVLPVSTSARERREHQEAAKRHLRLVGEAELDKQKTETGFNIGKLLRLRK